MSLHCDKGFDACHQDSATSFPSSSESLVREKPTPAEAAKAPAQHAWWGSRDDTHGLTKFTLEAEWRRASSGEGTVRGMSCESPIPTSHRPSPDLHSESLSGTGERSE